MWTNTSEGQKLIKEISRNVVAEVAPEEIDLFEELTSEYFANQEMPQVPQKDDPLAFGIDEIMVAVTIAASAMVKVTLSYLTTEFVKVAKEDGKEVVREKIQQLFSGDKKDKKFVPLSKEQLRVINKLAVDQAVEFGISPQKAENMAKALIGALSMRK